MADAERGLRALHRKPAAFHENIHLGGTAAGQILCLCVPALLYAKWKSGSVAEALRLRPVASGITLRVVLLAVTFIGLGSLLSRATQPVMERPFAKLIPVFEMMMEILTPKSATGLVGNLVVVGLLAPVCEEVLFRGAFQGALERRGPVRAILTSALVFTLVHLNPFDFLGIFVIAIGLGFVTWRTQSLGPAILWHLVNNSAATVLFYFGGESFSTPLWLDALLAVAFIGLAWEFVRYTKRDAPAIPGPLAIAPPSLGRTSSRLTTASGIALVFLVLAGAPCFGRVRLASDHLSPDYARGDIAIYLRGPAFRPATVQPGDVVLYRQNKDRLKFSRIRTIEGEQLTVEGRAAENGDRPDEVVARKDLRGKFVWKIDPGEELKQMMREIEVRRKPTPEGSEK